jgi:hypothetical protein
LGRGTTWTSRSEREASADREERGPRSAREVSATRRRAGLSSASGHLGASERTDAAPGKGRLRPTWERRASSGNGRLRPPGSCGGSTRDTSVDRVGCTDLQNARLAVREGLDIPFAPCCLVHRGSSGILVRSAMPRALRVGRARLSSGVGGGFGRRRRPGEDGSCAPLRRRVTSTRDG